MAGSHGAVRWDDATACCLSCGNCIAGSLPDRFCTAVEDSTDLTGPT